MDELETLKNLILAPYTLKATALIGTQRKVGGNQFRHSFSVLGILFDYKYFYDSVLLKASLLHDLLEELPETQIDEIRYIDYDAPMVVDLVLEVTRRSLEPKCEYLQRVLYSGSFNAKILKCADRISNLTDLHPDIFDKEYIKNTIADTKKWVVPMAEQVNKDMLFELQDLIKRRETNLKFSATIWPMKRVD